ncbi:tyrosine-type recombinase/integrase [Methylocystis echinoides]|nr:site-specific integrase [Methylocystis echinoides]
MARAAPLTVKEVKALQPRATRYEVRDWAEPGLYIVVYPSGSRSFVWRYSFGNRPKKLVLGPVGLAEARRKAREARHLRDDGTDPAVQKKAARLDKAEQARNDEREVKQAAKRARDDVGAVIEQFAERHCAGLRSGETVARVLRREVGGAWKGRRLSEIARADVHDLLDMLVDRGAPTQANRLYAYLNKMCGWALSRDMIDRNPCDGVAKPTKETGSGRTLDDRELALVWNAARRVGWPFGDIARLLILTGQRKSEISDATWKEIDLEAHLLRLPAERVKNGRAHDCPLSAQAIAILEALPRMDSQSAFVFTTTGKSPVSGFSKAKREIDEAIKALNGGEPIPAWTYHDLRRSAATGMGRIGVDVVVVERALNHVSGSFAGIVGAYQKQKYEREVRAALDAWGRHVERIVTGEASGGNILEFGGRT